MPPQITLPEHGIHDTSPATAIGTPGMARSTISPSCARAKLVCAAAD
ncbi:hypothetical protein [Streptomyces sp. NPDC101115]